MLDFSDGALLRRAAVRYGTPLLLLDCDRVRAQYAGLRAALPGVTLHYAIKALPHPAVVATLADAGAHFDIATSGEIALLRSARVEAARTIHTHPVKRDADIRAALRYGCRTFVVDNPDELRKFVPHRRRAAVLIRVAFRNADARIDLSKKFGCAPSEVPFLLAQARRLGVRVDGLSFHVGSQCLNPSAYVDAIRRCGALIAEARAADRDALGVLDIGGGFPVGYADAGPDIDAFCAPIRAALAALPAPLRVIAEPGRFLVADAAVALTSVIGRARRDGRHWYYLDDGVYGSFSSMLSEGARYPLSALPAAAGGEPLASVLAGPTCDSVDLIAEDIALPELAIGDLIVARVMGAYTAACASEFNSIPRTRVVAYGQPGTAARDAA